MRSSGKSLAKNPSCCLIPQLQTSLPCLNSMVGSTPRSAILTACCSAIPNNTGCRADAQDDQELEEQKKREISAGEETAAANPSVTVATIRSISSSRCPWRNRKPLWLRCGPGCQILKRAYKRLTDMMKNMPEIGGRV